MNRLLEAAHSEINGVNHRGFASDTSDEYRWRDFSLVVNKVLFTQLDSVSKNNLATSSILTTNTTTIFSNGFAAVLNP
jgi:hypothetical protein